MNQYSRFSTGATKFTPFGTTPNPMANNLSFLQKADSAFVYNRIHNLKTQMPQDVLELFKANQIAFLKPIKKVKCRKLDPVCLNGSASVLERFKQFEMQVEDKDEEIKVLQKTQYDQQRIISAKKQLEDNIEMWNPFEGEQMTSDPYKTLVVARLNYATTEKGLKHQFEKYGSIKNVRIIRDKQSQSKGYGFVEFEKKQDFLYAYKNADQKRFDGRRIVVDFEKGRTYLSWRPRRLGGGQGQLRLTPYEKKIKQAQRAVQEQQRKVRNKSRERSRDQKKKRDRSRQKQQQRKRQKQRQRQRQKQQQRERQKEKQRMARRQERERQDRERQRQRERNQRHKQRKDRDKSKSRKKEKKEKKDKKDKKDYISYKQVPVEEFM